MSQHNINTHSLQACLTRLNQAGSQSTHDLHFTFFFLFHLLPFIFLLFLFFFRFFLFVFFFFLSPTRLNMSFTSLTRQTSHTSCTQSTHTFKTLSLLYSYNSTLRYTLLTLKSHRKQKHFVYCYYFDTTITTLDSSVETNLSAQLVIRSLVGVKSKCLKKMLKIEKVSMKGLKMIETDRQVIRVLNVSLPGVSLLSQTFKMTQN